MLPATRRQEGRRGWWLLLAFGVVCFVGGGVLLRAHTADGSGVGRDAGIVPVGRVAQVQMAGLAARVAPGGGSNRLGSHPGSPGPAAVSRSVALAPPPVRLRLPRLHVDAPVLPVSVGADGLLGVPDNPRQLGWWTESGRPGMPSGSVVIDGHVDSAALGPGALLRLGEARPGDEVVLMNASGGSTRYTVVARRSYAKTSLPLAEVFGQDVGPRLVLITCGGVFDQATGHYADNVVVYAVPR
jgi:hypothetical protein